MIAVQNAQPRLAPFDPQPDTLRISSFDDVVDFDVRYCETDGARHVNHASVPVYLEHGLLTFLRRICAEHGSAIIFGHVTAELTVRYIAPSFFGESLQVGSKLVHLGRTSAVIEQLIVGTVDRSVRVAARTTIVRTTDGRSTPWTPAERQYLLAALAEAA